MSDGLLGWLLGKIAKKGVPKLRDAAIEEIQEFHYRRSVERDPETPVPQLDPSDEVRSSNEEVLDEVLRMAGPSRGERRRRKGKKRA